jgi:HD-GYP domain-containing protein (c-di-GMP phosphodiesterase class II)
MEKQTNIYLEIIDRESGKIEERFSNGENLSSDDLHTIALKGQFKHIEILEKSLENIETNFEEIENYLDSRKNEIVKKFQTLEEKFEGFKASIREDGEKKVLEFKSENEKRFREIDSMFSKIENSNDGKLKDIEVALSRLEAKIESGEKEIGKEIVNTVKWYIGGIGAILVSLKLLDLLLK